MYRTVPVPNGFGTVRYQGPKSPYRTDTEPKKKNKFGIGMASIPAHTVPVPALTMVDKRIEFMLSSPTSEDTIIRKASFLKPIIPLGTKEPLSHLPTYSFPSLPLNFDPTEWSLEISFPSWVTRSHEAWNSWVDGMALEHQDLWKLAGVYEPILSSKCQINRDTRLLYGLAEKWCTETNTFIFQWGETTLTLEDVMILGGFSVLGDSIVSHTLDPEEVHIEKYLDNERKQFNKTTAKKPSIRHFWLTGYRGMFFIVW